MTHRDTSDLPLTGASTKAADLYNLALGQFHALHGEPFALVSQALADSPDFVMAHVLKANMLLVGTNPGLVAMGAAAVAQAQALPATAREQGHAAAQAAVLAGDLRHAARILEDVALDHPRDVLALQGGALMDFLLGDARMLRDRIARALPAWSADMPNYHAVLGQLAFGLEESGDYVRAEQAGRRAIELEPANSWAQHAVAHVLEMQDRRAEGVAWMTRDSTAWQADSLLAVHNWWHLSLFHLGLGDIGGALDLYDGPIMGDASDLSYDLVDGASLLWRLHLLGTDVGGRFQRLAETYEPRGDLGLSAFEDLHAMLTYAGAGRSDGMGQVLKAQTRRAAGDNAEAVRAVGLPAMRGIAAFAQGRHVEAVEHLRPLHGRTAPIGGSHAQRDVIELTLIAAAERSGEQSLVRALEAERAYLLG